MLHMRPYGHSKDKCQTLFKEAVDILRPAHEGLTVAALDNTIWRFYAKAKPRKSHMRTIPPYENETPL